MTRCPECHHLIESVDDGELGHKLQCSHNSRPGRPVTTRTRYDDVPGHPLAGIPRDVLDVARRACADSNEAFVCDGDDRDAVADFVVLRLRESGFIVVTRTDDD